MPCLPGDCKLDVRVAAFPLPFANGFRRRLTMAAGQPPAGLVYRHAKLPRYEVFCSRTNPRWFRLPSPRISGPIEIEVAEMSGGDTRAQGRHARSELGNIDLVRFHEHRTQLSMQIRG